MATIINQQDRTRESRTQSFPTQVATIADFDSLQYMARQRARRAAGKQASDDAITRYAAAWVDAFLVGAQFQATKTQAAQQATGQDSGDGRLSMTVSGGPGMTLTPAIQTPVRTTDDAVRAVIPPDVLHSLRRRSRGPEHVRCPRCGKDLTRRL